MGVRVPPPALHLGSGALRTPLLIGIACLIVGIGVGVALGAGIWSGGPGESATPPASEAKPAVAKSSLRHVKNVKLGTYTDSFTLIAQSSGLTFTPDYGPSNCAVPGVLKDTGWYAGGLGEVYEGSADINNSGSCWFEVSYAHWKFGKYDSLVLGHSMGSFSCEENCYIDNGNVILKD